MSNSFTIPQTGREVRLTEVTFDESSNHFFLGGFDVTDYMTVAQMKTFDGFDIERLNEERYVESYQAQHNGQSPPPVGSTSILENFVSGFTIETGPMIAIRKWVELGIWAAAIWLAVEMWNTFKPKKKK